MNLESVVFFIFKWSVLVSSLMVVSTINSIHAVFFLILTFCAASGLFFLCQIEFVSMVIIIVYVGAIAVLFLFMVMMLNIRLYEEINKKFIIYFPVASFIIFMLVIQISVVIWEKFSVFNLQKIEKTNWLTLLNMVNDMQALGGVIYTHFFLYFQIAGFILLIAMIASIHLTFSKIIKNKKQFIFEQVRNKTHTFVKIVN